MAMAKQIGYIGLGEMGGRIASKLHRISPVKVWNRTPYVSQLHANTYKTTIATDLKDFRHNRVIFMCLPTSKEVSEIVDDLDVDKGTIIIDNTSGCPFTNREIAKKLLKRNIHYLDAPVSGGPKGAAESTLTTIISGHERSYNKYKHLLSSFSSNVFYVGGVGNASAIKAINNYFNISHLMMECEGLIALKQFGIDPKIAVDVINKSSGRSLMTEKRIPEEILSRRFRYGFSASLMQKDINNANKILSSLVGQNSDDSISSGLYANISSASAHISGIDPNADYTQLIEYLEHKYSTKL